MFLLQPSLPSPPCPPPRGRCPVSWQTGGSEPAAAPGDSRRRVLSSWWKWTAVGSGAASRRARRSAESNKWSGYPITSLSTSVPQSDMARREIHRYHLANAKKSILKPFNCWRGNGAVYASARAPVTENGEDKTRFTHMPAGKRCAAWRNIQGGRKTKGSSSAKTQNQDFSPKLFANKRIQRRLEDENLLPVSSLSSETLTPRHPHSPSILTELSQGGDVQQDGEWWWRLMVHPLFLSVSTHADCTEGWSPNSGLNCRSRVGEGGGFCYERDSECVFRWLRGREKFHTSTNNPRDSPALVREITLLYIWWADDI